MKKLISLMLALCMLLTLGACSKAPAAVEETTKDTEVAPTETTAEVTTEAATEPTATESSIIIGLVGEPDSLIPYMFTSDKDSLVQTQLFPHLFSTDNSGSVVPNMVETCTYDDATLTYTWKIYEGAKWSDGEDLNIDDVIFTLNTLAAPDYTGGSSTAVTGIVGYSEVNSGEAQTLSGVTRVDDYTCSIQLTKWDPVFLNNFSDPGSILPEHALKGVAFSEWAKTDFAEHPVTCGNYNLVKWEHGEYIELKKNDAYYGTPANIDKVIFRFAEDATTFVNAFVNGEIDMFKAPFEDVDTLSALEFSDAYVCTPSNFPLYPNLIRGPLTEVKVRQAVRYSYNPDLIATTVFGEYAEGANSVFCNASWARNPEQTYYTEDHDKAKSLLEEAGYTMGTDGYYEKDGQVLEITSLCTGGEAEDCLTMWQAALKKSGIKVNIKLVDWSVMVETISNQEVADYGTYAFGGGDGDPSGLMVLYCSDFDASLGGFNFNKCGDETLDALWYAGQAETDHDKRTEIYHQIDDYMTENALLFPLYEKYTVWMVNNRIQNVNINGQMNLLNLYSFTAK